MFDGCLWDSELLELLHVIMKSEIIVAKKCEKGEEEEDYQIEKNVPNCLQPHEK